MFSQLSEQLDHSFRKLRGLGKLTEKNIAEALREIRMTLLDADVDFGVAKDLIAKVQVKSLGQKVITSIKPGEQIVKLFQDELITLLGENASILDLNPPARILLCGLNGAGKTTASAKLALKLKKEGRNPVLIACDLYRPAAIDQLAVLAKQIGIPCYLPDPVEKDVIKVAKAGLDWAKKQNASVTIFDTAGRQEVDESLLTELTNLHKFVSPKETLLVVDSATGQQAVNVAISFDEKVSLSGIILTKLDGDARGGAALSMKAVTGKPIKYIGEGEQLEQLDIFYPDRLANRILGMGNIVSLVEQAKEKLSEQAAVKATQRMKKGQFDFNDFLNQLQMLEQLGPLEGLLEKMPGFHKIKKQIPNSALDPKRFIRMQAMVQSMTPKERVHPEIIKFSRRQRIANGSGSTLIEVNQFLKQFGQMRSLFRSKGKMQKMMQMMGGDNLTGGMMGPK